MKLDFSNAVCRNPGRCSACNLFYGWGADIPPCGGFPPGHHRAEGSAMGLLGSKPTKDGVFQAQFPPPSEGILGKLPGLGEYISSTRWDDGGVREPATLIVFYEAGMVKVCLSDRALSRTCFVSGASLEVCLKALEARLQEGTSEWRPARGRK